MKKPKPNLSKAALPLLLLFTVLLFGALQSCVDHQECDRDNPEIRVDSLQDNYDGRFPYKPSWTELEYIYEDDSTEAEVLTFQLYQRDTIDHNYNSWDGGGCCCITYKYEANRYYYKVIDSYGREHHLIISRQQTNPQQSFVGYSFNIKKVDWFIDFKGIASMDFIGPLGRGVRDSVRLINGKEYYHVTSDENVITEKEDTIYHTAFAYNREYGLIQEIDHTNNRVYTLNKLP